jgi:hypothetical protein
VLWRLRRPGRVSARLIGLLATAVSLWIVTGLARSTISPPESSRYIYLGAVTIVLIGVELLANIKINARATAIAAALVLLFVLTGLTSLSSGSSMLWETSQTVTAELGALQVAAAYAPPGYRPDPVRAPPIYAGPYMHTVRSIGSSPADNPSRIAAANPVARAAADSVLLALEAPKLTPISSTTASSLASSPPRVLSIAGGSARSSGPCTTLTPSAAASMTTVLALPAGGVLIRTRRASVGIAARRFGEAFVPVGTAHARELATLIAPSDAVTQRIPWQVKVSSSSLLQICTLKWQTARPR